MSDQQGGRRRAEGGRFLPEAIVWYGAYGPKALPTRLALRWNEAINRYMKTPQAQAHWRRTDMIGGGTSGHFTDFRKRETGRWSAVIKAARIEPQQHSTQTVMRFRAAVP